MNTSPAPSLIDRTLSNLRRAWRDISGGDETLAGSVAADLPDGDIDRLRKQIAACLATRGGEVSARARAADLGRVYLELDEIGRERFLTIVAKELDIDRLRLDTAISGWREAGDDAAQAAAEKTLREVLQPPRLKLLTQFNGLPEGVKFLVDMRADLLDLRRKDPALAALNTDLRDLLVSWFDVGFLDLRRITWEAPAALLEKLIDYEAVHRIESWEDLKNRLDSDRRCFAFFHPSMPHEPLIFVEVALVQGMAANVQDLLAQDAPTHDPEAADTAIFYSISNCQKGLAGVSFGNFLIKTVVGDLARDLTRLKTFATLSPIPGWRRWLKSVVHQDDVLTAAEVKALRQASPTIDGLAGLDQVLDRDDWVGDQNLVETLKPILMRLVAHYILNVKRGRQAIDRVAHFHLSNGARVERLNWLGDTSAKGLAESAGMMINYLYKLSEIEGNHEVYSGLGRIAASPGFRRLIKV